MTSSFVD